MSGQPLRIAVDATAIPPQMAGAGVYTYQLVRGLAGLTTDHEFVVFSRGELFDDLATPGKFRVVHISAPGRTARLAWEQARLPSLLQRLDVDVLHSPHHHTPVRTSVRRVVTFHDVTFLLIPERYPIARRLFMESVTRAAARVADAIVTPSEAVRDDVIEKLGVGPDRVVAIPEAAGPQFTPSDGAAIERVQSQYDLPERYLLSVGSLEPGKNRGRLILAYRKLRAEGVATALVIAGQPAWQYQGDYELVNSLGLADHVRFLGYVPDDDLPALYSGAALLAFPSLYEGFGLPVLEAMACGTPVVTSIGSAPAEVAGDAALLVDPRDVAALTDALGRVLSDETLAADLRARGLERAAQYSWQRAARETLFLYELVGAKG